MFINQYVLLQTMLKRLSIRALHYEDIKRSHMNKEKQQLRRHDSLIYYRNPVSDHSERESSLLTDYIISLMAILDFMCTACNVHFL